MFIKIFFYIKLFSMGNLIILKGSYFNLKKKDLNKNFKERKE